MNMQNIEEEEFINIDFIKTLSNPKLSKKSSIINNVLCNRDIRENIMKYKNQILQQELAHKVIDTYLEYKYIEAIEETKYFFKKVVMTKTESYTLSYVQNKRKNILEEFDKCLKRVHKPKNITLSDYNELLQNEEFIIHNYLEYFLDEHKNKYNEYFANRYLEMNRNLKIDMYKYFKVLTKIGDHVLNNKQVIVEHDEIPYKLRNIKGHIINKKINMKFTKKYLGNSNSSSLELYMRTFDNHIKEYYINKRA